MFKKSLVMVSAVLTLVFASAFTSQILTKRELPSNYDPGLTIQKAFQTSKVPLLVEFYSDACGTCQKVAPMMHDIQASLQDRSTLVMMNVEEPENQHIAQLFGVDELPGVYVFDFKHMRKHQISSQSFRNREELQQAIEAALNAST